MKNRKRKNPEIKPGADKKLVYEYPRGEDMFIDRANLQIKLGEYKEKIKSSFSVFDLLAIVSLWAPVFSADFKSMVGIKADAVEFGYIVFAAIFSIIIVYLRVKFYFLGNKDVSSDPKEMAQKILEQCQKRDSKS